MSTYGQLIQFGPYPSSGSFTTVKIYHYIVGTTSLKDVYLDREKTQTAAQPVASDANGIVSFYADGIYKFRIDVSTDGSTYSTLYTYDKWAVSDQILSVSGEGAALTSAATLVLGSDGNFFHVTGASGPIAAISGALNEVTLVFDSTPTLSNGATLILRDATNYTVTAGDVFVFTYEGASIWRETSRGTITTPTKTYVDDFHQHTTASYSSVSNLAVNVDLALLNGSSFALTLPAAASYTGREVTIVHQGTSLTQIYTITGNGAENIIAKDGTATTYILYTAGEEVTLKSNGTGWQVRAHLTNTNWLDAGVMTITATSANPTKPTTPDIDKVYWRRMGNQVFLRYIFQISSAAGSAAGTGTYLFALPTNITFDTSIMTPVAGAYATATRSELSSAFLPGDGYIGSDTTSQAKCAFFANTTGDFKVLIIAATDANTANADGVRSGQYDMTNSEQSYNFELNARAANWRL